MGTDNKECVIDIGSKWRRTDGGDRFYYPVPESAKGIFVEMPVRGKSCRPGETAVYEGIVHNCTCKETTVKLQQMFEGWESMIAELCLDDRMCGESIQSYVQEGIFSSIWRFRMTFCTSPHRSHRKTRTRLRGLS